MCEVRSKGKAAKNQKIKIKSTVVSTKKKWTIYDEPHLAPNEKSQPIQWTEQPTGALVAAGSLWPSRACSNSKHGKPGRANCCSSGQ